jgi:hypothetical protein
MPRGSYKATKRTTENDERFDGESIDVTGNVDDNINAETIAGFTAVNPGDIGNDTATDNGNGSTGKRRGRKPGTKNKAKDASVNLTAGLELLLLSVHSMGATFLSIEELALDPKEAKLLADAIHGVAEQFPVALDPKYIAIGNLATVAVGIYGMRIFAYKTRVKQDANKTIDTVSTVVNGSPVPNNVTQWPSFATVQG